MLCYRNIRFEAWACFVCNNLKPQQMHVKTLQIFQNLWVLSHHISTLPVWWTVFLQSKVSNTKFSYKVLKVSGFITLLDKQPAWSLKCLFAAVRPLWLLLLTALSGEVVFTVACSRGSSHCHCLLCFKYIWLGTHSSQMCVGFMELQLHHWAEKLHLMGR